MRARDAVPGTVVEDSRGVEFKVDSAWEVGGKHFVKASWGGQKHPSSWYVFQFDAAEDEFDPDPWR